MAIVSDIEIRLMANIAQLQQDMGAARRVVDQGMSGISKAAGVAKMALGALAGVLSIGAFAGWIKGAIDATDAVADISARTGIAISDIAALQLAFKKGGMEATDMEGSMVKLSKAIAEGDDSFARIGVATKTSNGALRESKDVLYDVADRFANLEDGTAKTALAMEIFGKSGAAMIPLLNDGSEGLRAMAEMADKLGITFDEKTVTAAGDFNDTLDFMSLAGQGVARQVAAQLLPTLNSLAGSFLTLVTNGDGVKKVADGIGAVFKVLYTIAVGVGQAFNVVGSIIGLAMAQVVAVMNGDFKTAASYGQIVWDDLSTSLINSAKSISDVWTGAGGEVVAALAETTKKTGAISAKVDKDAQKQVDSYKSLIASIMEKVAATDGEARGMVALNDAQKLTVKLNQDLADGRVKLTATQEAAVRAQIALYESNLAGIESHKQAKKAAEDLAKWEKELADDREKQVKAIADEAASMERQVELFGMSKAAIEEMELARLQEQMAQRVTLGLTLDEIDQLGKLIEARKRSAAAAGALDALEQQKEATKKATGEQIKFWDSLDKTAHDTFVSIMDGGKGAAQRLKDTFKNVFFDWIYQMAAKPILFNVGTNTSGLAAAAGAAGGGGSNMIGSAVTSALGSYFGAGGVTGALAAGAGWVTGATTLGGSLTAGASLISTGTLAGATSGLTMLAGTIAPIAIAAVVGSALLKKAFGRGPKETTGQGISGTFGADSFSGNSFTEWVKKGGWFRSDKKGVDTSPLAAETADALNSTYKMLKDSTSAFATALGVPTDAITGYTKQIKLALTGDATKDQQMLADLFSQMGDELATKVLPNISDFIAQGEVAAGTLQRLVAEFQTVDGVLATLSLTSQQAFGAVGTASLAARDRLVALSGGLEAMAQQTTFFADNFLTDAEKVAPAQKLVTEQLAKLGYTGLSTTEQFKTAVMDLASSGRLATEEGAKTYAGLLALAPAFKTVTDYTEQLAAAAKDVQAANDIQAAKDLQAEKDAAAAQVDLLRSTAGEAMSALQRAVDSRKSGLTKSFESLMTGIENSITTSSNRITSLKELSGALSSANVPGTEMSRQQGQAQILAALAIAKASGVLPDAAGLRAALNAAGNASEDEFSSFVDFQRNQLLTANSIIELGAITDTQLSVEQHTLAALEAQKATAQAAYSSQIAYLDEMLARAQTQVDAINGVNVSVLTVRDAFAAFSSSIGAALSNQTIGSQSSVTGSTKIEALYNSLLGRTSDAGGMKYYLDRYNAGASLTDIEAGIRNSQEYSARAGLYTAQQSGTMGGNSSVDALTANMAKMETALSKIANSTSQFATQFDSATNGGGPLLVEPA